MNVPVLSDAEIKRFQTELLAWFDQHGRKQLPWQQNPTPYRVWLSEIMLQQTQVATVVPYFVAFTAKFNGVEQLAAATVDEVLKLWSGLGYYARARHLHQAAQQIVARGYFPDTLEDLTALPGIGRSTAGAILSIAFKKPHAILDGNVKRVLSRCYGISGWPGQPVVSRALWALSVALTPLVRVADYTQAIMDLGATLCTRHQPVCHQCPLQPICMAYASHEIANYPTPKPLKILAVKTCVVLILRNSFQEIRLEKRPPLGIWGGLWSLPEFQDIEAARDWCLMHRLVIDQGYCLPCRQHKFSHFRLEYTPWIMDVENFENCVLEADRALWYHKQQHSLLALPMPIKLLLEELT